VQAVQAVVQQCVGRWPRQAGPSDVGVLALRVTQVCVRACVCVRVDGSRPPEAGGS